MSADAARRRQSAAQSRSALRAAVHMLYCAASLMNHDELLALNAAAHGLHGACRTACVLHVAPSSSGRNCSANDGLCSERRKATFGSAAVRFDADSPAAPHPGAGTRGIEDMFIARGGRAKVWVTRYRQVLWLSGAVGPDLPRGWPHKTLRVAQ